jgi:uncharacterized membrane protein
VSFGAGVAVSVAAGLVNAGRMAPLSGWDIMALVYGGWTWFTIWPLGAAAAEADANREDPGRDLTDLVLLSAAVASLVAVGAVLLGVGGAGGYTKYLLAALALVSVFLSWALVHTVYTLKYARLYYTGTPGGIDFNGTGAPDYHDFAYLAFTIGMTFQISDTNLQSKQIRRTVPLVTVIIATAINLVAGLAK